MELKSHYWDQPELKSSFKRFMVQIHSLDFTRWELAGFWDYSYTPFSYFEQDRVISSVCVYLLDAVIKGRTASILQISGVGTVPEWRRKGLNRKLTEIALSWAFSIGKHEFIFLFSEYAAIPFYNRCGFRPIDEYIEVVEVTPVPKQRGIFKMTPENKENLDRIYDYSMTRSPASDVFSVLSSRLFMFHILYGMGENIYEIPDLSCIVLFNRVGSCLRIFDIVGKTIPTFSDLYPYLSKESDRTVEFHFSTDKLELRNVRKKLLNGNNPFIKGEFPLEKPIFPYTSRA